ncbi:MAG: serine/threonine-protein kinase [Nocardioidaceae bacterium]
MNGFSTGATVAAGRYRLDAHLATGGMGEVWRATDSLLGRPVVLKLLKAELAGDAGFRSRLLTEARHAAALSDPHIAGVYDVGETPTPHGPVPYLVLEYVEGDTLSGLLTGGPLPPKRAVGLVAQAADALQVAHDKGIVHRDVKPSNLLVTPQGSVKVTDFGIAKAAADASVTATGQVMGTPHYLSPEQAAGSNVSPSSDVYSLGVVLHEALSGARPFDRETPMATLLAHLHDAPPPLGAPVPPALAGAVARALAKDPTRRQASAAAFASEIRQTTGDLPDTVASPAAVPTRLMPTPAREGDARAPRRRALALGLVGAGVVAALLVTVVALNLDSGTIGSPPGRTGGTSHSQSPGGASPTTTGTRQTSQPGQQVKPGHRHPPGQLHSHKPHKPPHKKDKGDHGD